MPIKECDIKVRPCWNGTSADPNDPTIKNLNKDSSMSEEEHRVIILKSFKLLEGQARPDVFNDLWDAYKNPGNGIEVYMKKGIHQPYTDAHILLETQLKGADESSSKKYHLNLEAVDVVDMITHFQWVGVQFSRDMPGNSKYPFGNLSGRKMKGCPTVPHRRNSIDVPGIDTHRQTLKLAADQAKAAAAEKKISDMCTAFEDEHEIQPIRDLIDGGGWGSPIFQAVSRPGSSKAIIQFKYCRITNKLSVYP